MTLKENHIVFGVLTIGAIALLVYLMRRSAAPAVAAVVAATPASSSPSYPNAAPIKTGDFNVGGNTLNLTYNTPGAGGLLPTLRVGAESGDAGCECNPETCQDAGQLTTVQTIPAPVYQRAADNFVSFKAKQSGFHSGSAA